MPKTVNVKSTKGYHTLQKKSNRTHQNNADNAVTNQRSELWLCYVTGVATLPATCTLKIKMENIYYTGGNWHASKNQSIFDFAGKQIRSMMIWIMTGLEWKSCNWSENRGDNGCNIAQAISLSTLRSSAMVLMVRRLQSHWQWLLNFAICFWILALQIKHDVQMQSHTHTLMKIALNSITPPPPNKKKSFFLLHQTEYKTWTGHANSDSVLLCTKRQSVQNSFFPPKNHCIYVCTYCPSIMTCDQILQAKLLAQFNKKF